MVRTLALLFFLGVAAAASQAQSVQLVNAFPNLNFRAPVDFVDPDDGTNRLFVVGQEGLIWTFDNDAATSTKTVFLDIRDRVQVRPDNPGCGLLSLALHPDFAANGRFFVTYCTGDVLKEDPSDPILARLSEFALDANDSTIGDPSTETVLLELEQTDPIHNIGHILFGPDDMLFVGIADGGPAGDPFDNGQDPTNLLGTIIRISVDSKDPGLEYAIPADNPFVGNSENIREEIYAYGFRNPWRMFFDNASRLWVGDTGDSSFEEVNWVTAGANYGWNTTEGDACFPPKGPQTCDKNGITEPQHIYDHSTQGPEAVIGGHVYNGDECRSSLFGDYLYVDAGQNDLWALSFNAGGVLGSTELVNRYDDPDSETDALVSLGKDRHRATYILLHVWSVCERDNGKILKLSCSSGPSR